MKKGIKRMDAKAALLSKNRTSPMFRENEIVLAETIISEGIYFKPIAICIVAIIFLLIAWQLTLFFFFVAVVSFIFVSIKKTYLQLVVTDQRVLVKSGILMTDVIQYQYNKIEAVETQTTLLGRFLGYTTLMVSGTGSRMAYIPFVKNAAKIQSVINEILQRHDTSGQEHMKMQARVQAEALAEVLEENKEIKS